ncbi:hypothetical protein AncyloWKF20_00385 [Ancylobacter sp. WKF20]|uniref:hypothetical protein n=1 Tax=Ancylobacter sp. WKF20 TaxID=3039801 RepID=UPI0024345030|nr:hypothetical protein [Ancylobacter sp. WKF20]WGD30337.1 hypothetical protein AncyloWKF20_00385 [Ancylobacter sp. WKF20]
MDIFEAVRVAALQHPLALIYHDQIASFSHQRSYAEREARTRHATALGGETEVTLDEIYELYREISQCGDDLRDFLLQTELDAERSFLFASIAGLRLFNELQAFNKEIILISDMYLPSAWLGETLERVGYAGAPQLPIFVSGEHRKSKHTGALYDVVRETLRLPTTARWLHVGDNPVADIAQAKARGIETKLADWAIVDNRRQRPRHRGDNYLITSILDFLDQPQASHLIPNNEYEEIGYRIAGPLIFGFLIWTLKNIRLHRLNHAVFVARDGWLPYLLFKKVQQRGLFGDVTSTYIHFSRATGYQIGRKGWDVSMNFLPVASRTGRPLTDSLKTLGYERHSVEHLLERHGLDTVEHISDSVILDAVALVGCNFAADLREAHRRRIKFQSYFETHFRRGQRTGIIDIGWNGNIQRLLMDCLPPDFDKADFMGLFIGLFSSATNNRQSGLNMEGWLTNFGSNPSADHYLQSGGVELLEFALTADHGTTLGYEINEDGVVIPVLEELKSAEAIYRERAMSVQAGIRKFFDDHLFLLDIYNPDILASVTWSRPFERLVTDPTAREMALLADLSHSDGAGSTSTRLPLAARQPYRIRRSRRRLQLAREKSFWKYAFDKLNR